jgi:hypothetical protein
MLHVQGLRFERLFGRVTGLHITMDDVERLEKNIKLLEDKDLALRILSAFDRAETEGRILIHCEGHIISAGKVVREDG